MFMKRSVLLIIAAAILLMTNICFGAPASAGGRIIPPPPINIPYGAKISCDINISNSDILGIIKQAMLAVAATSDEMLAQAKQNGGEPAEPVTMINKLHLQDLDKLIDGVKGVRVVVARYNKKIDPSVVTKDFEKGLVKTGTFSKASGGLNILPGVVELYSEAENAGYVAFTYDPQQHILCVMRIVGSLDISKLSEWAVRTAGVMDPLSDESGNTPGMPTPADDKDSAAPASNQ